MQQHSATATYERLSGTEGRLSFYGFSVTMLGLSMATDSDTRMQLMETAQISVTILFPRPYKDINTLFSASSVYY